MMQHVLSALFLPAVPVSFSGILMAIAAFLAGSVLLGTIVRAGFRLVMASARKDKAA